MKRIVHLVAWNWQMARLGHILIAALLAAVQAALLVAFTLEPDNAAARYSALFSGSGCPLAFAAAYCGAAVTAQRPLWLGRGRSHAAYTMLTFPMPRWQLLLAQTLSTALPLALLMAWELALAAAFYWPVQLLQGAAGVITASLPGNVSSFWWEFADNLLVRLLLPVTFRGWAALLLFLAAPAVLVPAMFLHTGWRRVGAALIALAGGFCCLPLARASLPRLNPLDVTIAGSAWTFSGLLLALLLACWLWSLRALHRAEPAA